MAVVRNFLHTCADLLTATAPRLGRFLLALGVGVVAVFFLTGCARGSGWESLTRLSSDGEWARRVEAERAMRAGPATTPAVAAPAIAWFPELARLKVDAETSHGGKAEELQRQLDAVEAARVSLDSEAKKLRGELAAERRAVVRERLFIWCALCGALAAACIFGGFVFPAASAWLWRGAVGAAVLAALLGAVAVYLAWWVWVVAAVLVAVAVWALADQAKVHGRGFVELFAGIQHAKEKLGDAYKAPLRLAQSKRTTAAVDQLRKTFGG